MALRAKMGIPKSQLSGRGTKFEAPRAKLRVLKTKLGALGTKWGSMVLWEPTFGSGSQNEGACLDQLGALGSRVKVRSFERQV